MNDLSHPAIHPIDIIRAKRDGKALSDNEIQAFVDAVIHIPPRITDAQIASFLMAVFQRGLNPEELAALTRAMRFSGDTFQRTQPTPFRVDKHSTGGVGDKTSLLIAPIVAAAGLADPMISGRSLGHTGGTLDKLETIPGFSTQFSVADFTRIVDECGFAMAGQTPTLVPADRILYGLRDHTGTIESPALITASIMSKKLAEDLDGLVLDVKTGSGAFMKTDEESRHLARLMVQTGEASGTRTVAVLSTMNQPLGRFAGNWLEVWECVDILKAGTGPRPPLSADLIDLSLTLAGWMLFLGGKAGSPEEGYELADHLLVSRAAYQCWLGMVRAQHGDTTVFDHPGDFHQPVAMHTLRAPHSGYFAAMDCTAAGWAVQRLGAGRLVPGGPVSAHAGIEMHAKLGDHLTADQPLITLYSEDEALLSEPFHMLREAIHLTHTPPTLTPLIGDVITHTENK